MNLINKKFFIIISATAIIIYLILLVLIFGNIMRQNDTGLGFNNILPGKTTEKYLKEQYGKPIDEEQSNGLNTLYYQGSKEFQYNYVWTKDGNVIATKENLPDNSSKKNLIENYGTDYITMLDIQTETGIWFIYLKKGIAILGTNVNDKAYSLIRFQPQTKEVFINNIANQVGMTQAEDLRNIQGEPGD